MNPQVSVESQEKIESFELIEIKAGDFESFGSFTVEEKQEMSSSAVDFIKMEESFQIFEVKAENQVKFYNFDDITVVEKQEILPSDHFGQQTPMENSSVENQSGIPVKETADLGQQTQLLDRPKKPPLQEIPPRSVSDQENISQENPSNTLVKPTAYRANAWLYDILGDRQNDTVGRGDSVFENLYKAQAIQNEQLLHKNSELNISLLNLVILYDEARSNCKKGKVLQDLGANIKFLADPEWFTNERSSLSEENKIWRENREALDANLKELISMLKIASASDTPVRYNTSTLSLGETIAEELKPYATELNEFENYLGRLTGNRRALDANIEKLITMIKITVKLEPFSDTPDGCDAFTINAETMAEEIKPHATELEAITNSIRSKQFETQKKKILLQQL